MFVIDVSPINKALGAVERARIATGKHDQEREKLMREMAQENVGRYGVVKRDEMIEAMKAELQQTINVCKADVEAYRAAFIGLIDTACNADGSMLDIGDIALLNANAVTDMDLYRMLQKHSSNFTMQKAIHAYMVRNGIKAINGIEDIGILIPGLAEEKMLREFAQLFYDKCIDAVAVVYGYNAMFVCDRAAVFDMLRTMGLMDTINVDGIRFPTPYDRHKTPAEQV